MKKAERDAQGRFLSGWRGGPGRPARKTEERYLQALTEEVSVDEWKKIISTAKRQAIDGDKDARAWLSRYLIGQNESAVNLMIAMRNTPSTIEELRQRRDMLRGLHTDLLQRDSPKDASFETVDDRSVGEDGSNYAEDVG